MAYVDIWAAVNDATFQSRCRVGLWNVAIRVLRNAAGYPASGQEGPGNSDRVYARHIFREETRVTDKMLAQYAMLDGAISANPAGAADSAIRDQLNSVWAELRDVH